MSTDIREMMQEGVAVRATKAISLAVQRMYPGTSEEVGSSGCTLYLPGGVRVFLTREFMYWWGVRATLSPTQGYSGQARWITADAYSQDPATEIAEVLKLIDDQVMRDE